MLARRLRRLLVPASLLAALLSPVGPAQAIAYPYVHITSPATDGTTVQGKATVQVSGTLDPSGTDTIDHMMLFIDGVPTGTQNCQDVDQKSCSVQLPWDGTGLSGSHQVQVLLVSRGGVEAHSQIVTVAVVSPPPTATIDSPLAGSTVGGDDIDVEATVAVDPSQTDFPTIVRLLVDGMSADSLWCPAAGFSHPTCTVDLDWNTHYTTLGDHLLQVEVNTGTARSATSPDVHVTLAEAPDPVVTVTSPSNGSTVSGTTTVTATGSSAGWSLGKLTKYMVLAVDGWGQGPLVSCPPDVDVCTASFTWDAADLPGPHSLSVMFATGTRPNLSPAVSVIAVEPPPIAVITSPVTGSTVSGAVTVAAIGSVDPRVTDQPKSMQLVVDGTPYGRATTCPIGTTLLHDCAASLPWFTGSLYGPHSIQVRLQTARTSVLSASTTLFVAARQAKLTVAEIHYAGVDYIKGTVTGPGFLGISGATVTVTVTPAGGAPRTLTITSGPGGTFVAPSPIKPTVNTRLEASVGPELGSATATDFVGVNAKLACSVPASIRHGVAATVTCKTPGLPDGTVATLWYSGKTGVHAAAHAKAKNGKVTLTLTIAKKWQRIRAWVVTAGNKKYVTSQTRAFKVHVL